MIRAAIIDNGIEGVDSLYQSTEQVSYHLLPVTANFAPDLDPYDILIAPNGTDHVALYRVRERIAEFLAAGKTLFCFDGWFTDWVPGNRWIMDNSKKTIETRYRIQDDPYNFGAQFSAEALNFSHGISGWWACGYIEPAPKATVFMVDTWDRPLVVLDEVSTPGRMVLTASAPLGDATYATTDDEGAFTAVGDLYRAILNEFASPKPSLA